MFRRSSKFHKLKLSIRDEVPTQSQVSEVLGTDLAQVVFDYSHNEVRKMLGVTPPLQGIQGAVWISPENQLGNRIVLTPVDNDQIIKACTHQTILALGEELLQRYKRETEEQKTQSLVGKFMKCGYMFEAEKRRAIQLSEQKLLEQFNLHLNVLYKKFEDTLQREISKVQAQRDKDQQIAVVQERMRVTHEMLLKLRKEISYVITSVYDEFDEMYRANREKMIADFNQIIRKEHNKLSEREEEVKRQKNHAIQHNYHQLVLQYMSNIVYIVCRERERYCTEKKKIYTHFRDKLCTLKTTMAEQKEIMYLMKQEVIEKRKEKRVLQNNLRSIIAEFQKLISFTLHASPEETEFLETFKSVFLPSPEEMENVDSESIDERTATSSYNHRNQIRKTLNRHLHKQNSTTSSKSSEQCNHIDCLMTLEEKTCNLCTCSSNGLSELSMKSLNPCTSTSICIGNGIVFPPLKEPHISKNESVTICKQYN